MSLTIVLSDMDGVLLRPLGYHTSLRTSVQRIGAALGAPNTRLSPDQIAKLEALSVTNEWDSLAICTALTLLHLWQIDGSIRLDGLSPRTAIVSEDPPTFDPFLDRFNNVGDEPGKSAYDQLTETHPWLDQAQQDHLHDILHHAREIYNSPTLPAYQETVLGSETFQTTYGLAPQLEIESFLLKYDQPVMDEAHFSAFRAWLDNPNHLAGIMTNRPSACPPAFLSSPEAELGAQGIGLQDLPILGSGMLGWFASTQFGLPNYTFFKPHPLHALGLMQLILGEPPESALRKGVDLSEGKGQRSDWSTVNGARLVVFEDAAKGLTCALAARDALAKIDVVVDLELVGVTTNLHKTDALAPLADCIIPDINAIRWMEI
jgi:hypothetical protein